MTKCANFIQLKTVLGALVKRILLYELSHPFPLPFSLLLSLSSIK
jgi:hypothetical protein